MATSRIVRKPVGSQVETSMAQQGEENISSDSLLAPEQESTAIVEPKVAQNRARVKFSRVFTESWGIELLAWVISAISMIGIIITLTLYNNRTLSRWHLPIGVNTLIAILSQVTQVALMIPITGCISQLKWLWFIDAKKPRPLSDFETFDSASRGIYGSLLLIGRTHARNLASVGAALTVVSLAFQPITQQSLSFPQRLQSSGNATISYHNNMTGAYGTDGGGPLVFWTALYNGLANPNISPSDIAASCPSGNCTFDLFHSLGVCALPVVNLTHLLTYAIVGAGYVNCSDLSRVDSHGMPSCRYTLPNQLFLNAFGGAKLNVSSMISDYQLAPPISYPNPAFSHAILIDFFVIYYSNNTKQIEAIECELQFCGQTLQSSVDGGRTVTNITKTWNQVSIESDGFLIEGGPIPFLVNLDTLAFTMSFLTQVFQGENSSGYYKMSDSAGPSGGAQAIGQALLQGADDLASMNILMSNIATSITNKLVNRLSST